MELRDWHAYLDLAPTELQELVDMAIKIEDTLSSVETLTELGYFPPSTKLNELMAAAMGIIRQLHYLAKSHTSDREERKELDKSKREMERVLSESFSRIETAMEGKDVAKLRGALHIFHDVLYTLLEGVLNDVRREAVPLVRAKLAEVIKIRIIMPPVEEEERKRRGE